MKKDIHPSYNFVIFMDINSGFKFLTRSAINSKETMKWEDGNTYPLVRVEVSSQSHPFFTGKFVLIGTGGRVEKFMKKYNIQKKD